MYGSRSCCTEASGCWGVSHPCIELVCSLLGLVCAQAGPKGAGVRPRGGLRGRGSGAVGKSQFHLQPQRLALEVQLGWQVGGSSRAQGQGVGLRALASRGGVRVISEGSSAALALAAAGVHTGLPDWLGLHPRGASPFTAVSMARAAAEGFRGAGGGMTKQTVSWPSKQRPK